MKILVTGNLGYIGSVLTPLLQSEGHEITGFDCGYFAECLLEADLVEFSQFRRGWCSVQRNSVIGAERFGMHGVERNRGRGLVGIQKLPPGGTRMFRLIDRL